MALQLEIGHRTDVGRRRDHNEDCLGIYRPTAAEEIAHRGTMLVVADGMGGYAAGEIASRLAVEQVVNSFYQDLTSEIDDSLIKALHNANRAVIDKANDDQEKQGMGTTMAVAVIRDEDLSVTNVGDSRVYLLRNGNLSQVSQDHSWVAQLLRAGKITPEEAKKHPMRNVVTRSLGGNLELEVEVYPPIKLQRNDVIILCSDGLWGPVSADQIQHIVQTRSPQAAADALIEAANEGGGPDNITAIVCQVVEGPSDEDEFDLTEQLDTSLLQETLQLQDTQPMPRLNN
jgi:PPM family protein phosphatase